VRGAVVFSLIILGTKIKSKEKQANKQTKTGPCDQTIAFARS
jgi:hypothetical protein